MKQLFLCSHGLTSRFAHNLLSWFDGLMPRCDAGHFFMRRSYKIDFVSS
jgi:hypothetical protein